ncbi:hypothetical protein E1295_17960 [Nonomuraea mesophila]|uniref:Copper resistance protein CopC n=1 Tax=Nonomuraea mesophila TaxID=2530382 RepID=A0A4R5FJ49_9ACTN|nr:hypothetical protein [Nonomuraea mesophila]TDE52814.1 hypothetical protein E1295_17960 [Nonomuraea mesophila]
MRKISLVLLGVFGLLLTLTATAQAEEPVKAVHTEQVQAGPYRVTVGFSVWPLKAMQSLDFTFMPEGGIKGKGGTLTVTGPDGAGEDMPLVRHPRRRDVWGLDVESLDLQGTWSFRFAIDGPEGRGTGELKLNLLEQPGPPLAISWTISSGPLIGLVALIVVGWRRVRPRAS